MNQSPARKLIVYTAGALMLAGAAIAQQGDKPPPVAGVVTLGVTVAETDLIAAGHRVKPLISAPVYNDKGEKIGKIDDLIISPDGKLFVAVVDVGGFLGLGTHRVAIPVEQFKDLEPKVVLPGATKQALKELPEFHFVKS